MNCERTVSVNFPCALSEGHDGVCTPDPEGQLKLYGVRVEELRDLAQLLYDARRLGIVAGHTSAGYLRYSTVGKYVRLRAELERILPRDGGQGVIRTQRVRDAVAYVDSFDPL